jgi:hypothetical protein
MSIVREIPKLRSEARTDQEPGLRVFGRRRLGFFLTVPSSPTVEALGLGGPASVGEISMALAVLAAAAPGALAPAAPAWLGLTVRIELPSSEPPSHELALP